ncbi:hypothetical protein FBUS_05254 [Fasciolopsis buskii]|uniref:Fibronectin type-III domain-containing protein n=1 Tax=Fasciolopsis buskii TaxID=27845 RepID=A0A8E0VFP3_9TREM|nr:hypothetical protein FBUS_05254 [Fasciolopsis buski]
MPERLLAVWIQGWDQGYDYLPGDSTESVFNSPDYCEQHELTLIEWYSSGKRVYLGQIKINTSLWTLNDVHYGSHAITIEHELVQVLDRSELHIILFDQYLVVDTMKRLSTDTSPIILPTKSCKPFRLAVVQMVDQFTRVLLGSAQLDPAGQPSPRPGVFIEDNKLVIKWKPKTGCHLERVIVKVLRDGVPWKTHTATNGQHETTMSVPKTSAVYAVLTEFFYVKQFVERSDYVIISYEPVPQRPKPPTVIYRNQMLYVSWMLNETEHVDRLCIFVKGNGKTLKTEVTNPKLDGELDLHDKFPQDTNYEITLQAVNRFGASPISEPKHYPR